jgi:hypothetical protein
MRTLTSGWFAIESKYYFSCRASAYFAKLQGFVFQRKVDFYLVSFEEGTTFKTLIYCMKIYIDNVFSHAVPFGTILSISAHQV